MAAFRKGFWVLAVVLLALAGTSGTAYAQFHPGLTCTATSTPAQSRAEGIAELLGDIVLQCAYAAGITPSGLAFFQTNLSVTLNVNVTNNRDFGSGSETTDAIMEINGVQGTPVSSQSSLTSLTPQYGLRSSPATLQWIGINFPNPTLGGNPVVTTIRITNMRGNVSQLGIPSGEGAFPSAQVTAFVSIAGPSLIPITNNVLNVGVPLLGLVTRFRGPNQDDVSLPIVALQCVTTNLDSDNDIQSPISGEGDYGDHDGNGAPSGAPGVFSVRLSEGFASSFKTLGVATTSPAIGAANGQERGYPTPNSNCLSGTPASTTPISTTCGGATQGTRFILRFYNVPNGVRIATPVRVTGTSGGGHTLTLIKVAGTDANGAGAFGAVTTTAPVEVTISGGFGFVVYEVVESNPFAIENVVINVTAAHRANTANDLPAVGTLQMSAAFAPLSTVTTANASAPEPRFVDTGANRSMYTLSRCVTNLLFPFVTNQGGFDTGFAISNTTRDDKGTNAQAGACTLYYFGSTTGGGAAPPQQTTAVVPAGGQLVATLSGGNAAQNIAATPGFQGYMMALCQFQFAHGFAFITDGFGGVPTIAEGYLALVVPWNGKAGERSAGSGNIGESLGH